MNRCHSAGDLKSSRIDLKKPDGLGGPGYHLGKIRWNLSRKDDQLVLQFGCILAQGFR